jgi:uncharacterized integral membrane protein (TIGR00698 family)
MISRILFFAGVLLAVSGYASPPAALALGLAFGLLFAHPFDKESARFSRILLQVSVVGLGFGMNLHAVVHAGRTGFLYTLLSIGFAMGVGVLLARLMGVERVAGYLISVGTAVCGGSAIAAVGPVVAASDEQMAVSLGTIFVLNSVALLTFPSIGAALKLSQNQFGLWAALAIHDTSSVVGAAAKYGATALQVGTTVKLARALWIVPLAVGTAALRHAKARIQWPWFIALFCVAAVCNTYFPAGQRVYDVLSKVARLGLTLTLYLIGTGLSLATLKRVGHRPLIQGVVLWLAVSILSLWLIEMGWIAL